MYVPLHTTPFLIIAAPEKTSLNIIVYQILTGMLYCVIMLHNHVLLDNNYLDVGGELSLEQLRLVAPPTK